MACSAVTEVKSTPLNWNRNIQLKTLRNNQSKNHQRNITLHIQIMIPFTDFWESFNFIALVLRDSSCLKCLNLKFCAKNCRAPGQNWSYDPMPNVWMLCSFAQPLIHLDSKAVAWQSRFYVFTKMNPTVCCLAVARFCIFFPISFNLKMAPFPFFPQFVFLTRWIFNK